MIKNIFNRSITSKKFFDEDDKIIFSEEMRQLCFRPSWVYKLSFDSYKFTI